MKQPSRASPQAMIQYGILSGKYSTEIANGSLVQAMFRPAY